MSRMPLIYVASLAMCLALLAPGVNAAAPVAYPADSAMGKIQKRGKLIVAVRSDLPLFGYLNPKTNAYEGFDVDLAKEIAQALFGQADRIEFKASSAKTRIPMVKEGVADIALATITITPERALEVDFSHVYFSTGPIVGTLKKAAGNYRRLEDFGGKTLAVTTGSVYEKFLKETVPTIRVVLINTHAEILQAMHADRVDGIVSDEINVQSMMRHEPNLVKAVPTFGPQSKYGAAIKKGQPEFVQFVNGVIRDIKANGRWKEIYARNIDAQVPSPPPPE